ncbi:substrate-binding domain-containing protein [Lutimaribacter marinistellae]|uniref:Substrate-binding domain-containing protein n=1 Tax=Lutimaribacter marinistellae TaxID=1820329 RepID=A0ABV7TLZ6_9RHOB
MTDTGFPDHEYLTVKELAELLRLKERKVYDLAASGAVPCSRATGKLLFPAEEIRAWIAGAKTGGVGSAPVKLPPIVLGSHDPLLDWAIRQSRCGLATFFDGSLDGLDRFLRGEGMSAGLHVHDPENDSWNTSLVAQAAAQRNSVLISFAVRRRGLVFRPDAGPFRELADVAGCRIVPRQPESGTDRLFRHLAERAGVDIGQLEFAETARTEDTAVEAVRRGTADVAFGLEAVAQSYGLSFLPIIDEQFGLLVDRKAWFEPPFQTLLQFLKGDAFARRATETGGYDVGELGTVLWNG